MSRAAIGRIGTSQSGTGPDDKCSSKSAAARVPFALLFVTKLYHGLVFEEMTAKALEQLYRLARAAVGKWLGLSHSHRLLPCQRIRSGLAVPPLR